MIRLLFSTDEHISGINPAYRKDDYLETILNKIRWQLNFARENDVDAILHGGDLFNLKKPSRTSHKVINATISALNESPCLNYAILGNHDYSDYSDLMSQPIGVLMNGDHIIHLSHEQFRSDVTVGVVGVDYKYGHDYDHITSSLSGKLELLPECDFTVGILHTLSSMTGVSDIYGEYCLNINKLSREPFCPDVVMIGHEHKQYGVDEINGHFFVRNGSLSRVALNDNTLMHKPSVTMLQFSKDGIEITTHVVDHQPAHEVFDIERKSRVKKENKILDEFIEKLKGSFSSSDELDRVYDEFVGSKDFPQKLKNIVDEILKEADYKKSTK